MNRESRQIVQKLWSYCNILRDDGLSYPDYVEQLTYLLFLKMADERSQANPLHSSIIPKGYNWQTLVSERGKKLHEQYGVVLQNLQNKTGMLGTIFHKAENKIRDPAKLELLVLDLINKENWSALNVDVKGDAYEGLLEKNAQDTKTGAGQYFTPRPLINAIVKCISPRIGETIYDPACGTCGFLLAAHDYILKTYPERTKDQDEHLRLKAFRGIELVHPVTRLGAMNLLLHGIGPMDDEEAELPIITADSLVEDFGEHYDVIVTNPPFGKKSSVTTVNEQGGRQRQTIDIKRADFLVSTSNKQLNFLQHIRIVLNKPGRAAVVLPDNVLFEGGAGETIRRRLLEECNVHTLLRLPSGIFYAQGIRTNVLFFDNEESGETPATKSLWIYDLRTNMHFTLRTKRLDDSDLEDFVKCYKPENIQSRKATHSSETPSGRWREYSYNELIERDRCNLDIFWIEDESYQEIENLPDPDTITAEIAEDLRAALSELEEIQSNFMVR